MYENFKWDLKTIIPMILLMIFAFIVIPWLLSFSDSEPKHQEQMSGIEDPYWSP